jgi:uncharacterized protein (TIGR02466 family)
MKNPKYSTKATQFYFPTGIYKSNLAPKAVLKSLLQELEEDIFTLSQSDQNGIAWSLKNYPNGYTSYSSLDRLDLMTNSFTSLRKKINKHVQIYLKNLNYDCTISELVMSQCWANVMFENTVHTSHIHPNSIISGTFYVKTPAGSSPIKFEDPRLGYFMNSPQVSSLAPTQFQRFVKLNCQPGELVLFESWLRHEVPLMSSEAHSRRPPGKKSKEAQPRISISFNYGKK